jgi:hypothetical protein
MSKDIEEDRNQSEEEKKNEKTRQSRIGAILAAMVRTLSCWLAWKEDRPLEVRLVKGEKADNYRTYHLNFKDGKLNEKEQSASLIAALGDEPEATVHHKQRPLVLQLVLMKLKGLLALDRFKDVQCQVIGATTIEIKWPKSLREFNHKAPDLAELRKWRARTSAYKGDNKRAMVAEENFCHLLVALQGAQKISYNKKKWKAPELVIAYKPHPHAHSDQCRVLWTFNTDNKGDGHWVRADKALRVLQKSKHGEYREMSRGAINKVSKKLKLPKECNIQMNRFTKVEDWSNLKNLREHEAKLKTLGIIFRQVYTHNVSDTLSEEGIKNSLIAPWLSMTNSSSSSKHFTDKSAPKPINISMKLLLAGNKNEMKLLNNENRALLQEVRELAGLTEYEMPTVVGVKDDRWSPHDKGEIGTLAARVRAGDSSKSGKEANIEPVPDPDMNRWGRKAGFAYVFVESTGPCKELNLLEYQCYEVKTLDKKKSKQH